MKERIIYHLLVLTCLLSACDRSDLIKPPAVSSATPESTAAGIEILQRGGNAIDAAIAVSFALNVSEPAMSGMGGGLQIIAARYNQPPFVINGTTLSPKSIHIDSIQGIRRSTIPSQLKVLYKAYKLYGSGKVSWAECIAPAINLAENGFVIGPFRALVYKKYFHKLKDHAKSYLINDTICPKIGDTLVLPKLAKTLGLIAEQGIASFYSGDIANGILADMKRHNGWMTGDDLKKFPGPEISKPLNYNFRQEYEVYSTPPPTGGWVMLDILKRLDSIPPSKLVNWDNRMLALANVINNAHLSRRGLSKKSTYEAQIKDEFSTGETTHFSVSDQDGMMVGVTASINAYFGCGIESHEYGFLYNSYMDDFNVIDVKDHYFLKPNAPAYSSMCPTIIQRGGVNELVLGSPGSARIISTIGQLIQSWCDDPNLNLDDLLNQPRIHAINNKIFLEKSEQNVSTQLEKRGYRVTPLTTDLIVEDLNPYFGGVHAISYRNGTFSAADCRRDGLAKVLKE